MGLLLLIMRHILIFKKIEGKETEVPREIKELSKLSMDEWKIYFNGHWRFMGIQQKVHAAMFPDELPVPINPHVFFYRGDRIGSVLRVRDNVETRLRIISS